MVALALLAAGTLFLSMRLMAHYRRVPEVGDGPVVCPTRPGVSLDELLTDSAVLDYEVCVTEVVALDDDVVVGTTIGTYHLHLPWPFARNQALDRLHWWRINGTRLVAFHAPGHGLSGIADEHTGQFLCTATGA